MINIPIWLVCVYVLFVIITFIIGFATGYKVSDDAWFEWYIETIRNEDEEDITK